jgi:hypothetical protein
MANSVQELLTTELNPYTNLVNIKNVVKTLTRAGVKVVQENSDMYENRMVLYTNNSHAGNKSNKSNKLYRDCNGMVITNRGEILVHPIPPIVPYNFYDILENCVFNVTPLYDGTIINMYYHLNKWCLSTRRSYDCTNMYPDGLGFTYGGIVFSLLSQFNINLTQFNTEYSYTLCISSKSLHPYAKIDRITLIAVYNSAGEIVVENIPNLYYSNIKKYNYTELKEYFNEHNNNVDKNYFGVLITTDSENFISNNTKKIYKLESALFSKIQKSLYNPGLINDLRNMYALHKPIYTVVYNVLNNTIDNLISIMPEWNKFYEILLLVFMEISLFLNNMFSTDNKVNVVIVQECEKTEMKIIANNDFVRNLLTHEFKDKFNELGNGVLETVYNKINNSSNSDTDSTTDTEQLQSVSYNVRVYLNSSSQSAYQLYNLIVDIYNHINQGVDTRNQLLQ